MLIYVFNIAGDGEAHSSAHARYSAAVIILFPRREQRRIVARRFVSSNVFVTVETQLANQACRNSSGSFAIFTAILRLIFGEQLGARSAVALAHGVAPAAG
jgi:hypothetical protein